MPTASALCQPIPSLAPLTPTPKPGGRGTRNSTEPAVKTCLGDLGVSFHPWNSVILILICPCPMFQQLVPLLQFILGYGFKSTHGGGFSKRKIRGKEGIFCHWNGEPPASLPFLLSHFYSSCPKLKSGFVTQTFQGPFFTGMSLSWKTDTILLPSLSHSPSRFPILGNTSGIPGRSQVVHTLVPMGNWPSLGGQGVRYLLSYPFKCWVWSNLMLASHANQLSINEIVKT